MILPGLPVLVGGDVGLVLTAGEATSSGTTYTGYADEAWSTSMPAFGSISAEPIQGIVLLSLYRNEDGGSRVEFFGDTTSALASYTAVEVNGVAFPLSSPWDYSASSAPARTRGFITGDFGFVSSQAYRIRLV